MMANTNYPSAENSQTTTRVERKTNNTTKNIIIGVLAVALLGTWAYFLYSKNDNNNEYNYLLLFKYNVSLVKKM